MHTLLRSTHPKKPAYLKGEQEAQMHHVAMCLLCQYVRCTLFCEAHTIRGLRTSKGNKRPRCIIWLATTASMLFRLSSAYGRPTCMNPSCIRNDMSEGRLAAPSPALVCMHV